MRVDGTGDRRVAIVEGVAYPALVVGTDGTIAPEDVSRIDTYRTWMAPETLRRFAHFMLERGSGGIDSAHDHGNVCGHLGKPARAHAATLSDISRSFASMRERKAT